MSKKENKEVIEKLMNRVPEDGNGNVPNILNEFISCGSDCGQDFKLPKQSNDYYKKLEYIISRLPALPYVRESITNLVFSNGLTTGSKDDDDNILKPFLYKNNVEGETNYNVLRRAFKESLVYPKYGVRYIDDDKGIVGVDPRRYSALVTDEDSESYRGFYEVFAYVVSLGYDLKKGTSYTKEDININEDTLKKEGIIYDSDKKLMFVPPEHFINLRTDTSTSQGLSKLTSDKERIELLLEIYERLNIDIVNESPGRLLLFLNDSIYEYDESTSTTKILSDNKEDTEAYRKKVNKEVEGIAKGIRNSGSDSVIAVSNMFKKENVLHLPKMLNGNDLKWFVEQEGEIVSQILGVNPVLIGLGSMSGNVSMEKILDNEMMNSIIPMREHFAVQISAVLAPILGVDKIYFDKYQLKQINDSSAKLGRLAVIAERFDKMGRDDTVDAIEEYIVDTLEKENKDGKVKKEKIK